MRKVLIVYAFILLVSISCTSKPKRVVIGIALTQSNHPAIEAAVKEINDSGGVGGVPIEVMGLDWKVATDFDTTEILQWADKFSQTRDLIAVIGHSDSASTLSAAAFYNQHRIPQIVTIATNPAITNIGDWTYRLCLSDKIQGSALAEYAVRDWGKSRIVLFNVNDPYGTGLAEAFEREVQEHGGRIVSARMHRNVLLDDDKAMIRSTLASLKSGEEPDLFVLFQRMAAADWTIRAIREAGFSGGILGGDALGPSAFAKSQSALKEGMRVSGFFLPATDDTRATGFVEVMRQVTNREPDYGQAFAYDAVYLIREAILKYGFDRVSVKRYLDHLIEAQTSVKGAGGAYRIGKDHDARRALYIVEAHNGIYQPVKVIDAN
jgi:branched-chain amino acid transport system substrate-binding protein